MSENQETHSKEQTQPLDRATTGPFDRLTTEQPGVIARALSAMTRRTRRALSPWVQRWLRPDIQTAETPSPKTGLVRRRRAALTQMHTRSFLGRARQRVKKSIVWQPNVGSVAPTTVARFTGAIAERFSSLGSKYQVQPAEGGTAPSPELVLAESPTMPDLAEGKALTGPSADRRLPSSPTPKPPPFSGQGPPTTPRPAPPVRPAETQPPVTRRPTSDRPATSGTKRQRTRLFSRVEELPSEKGTWTEAEGPEAPVTAPAERVPAQGHALSRQLAYHMGIIPDLRALTENDLSHGHRRVYDRVSLNRDLENGGFVTIAQGGIMLKLLADFQMDQLFELDVLGEPQIDGLYSLGLEYPDLCGSIYSVCRVDRQKDT